jgi:hypothetical protein
VRSNSQIDCWPSFVWIKNMGQERLNRCVGHSMVLPNNLLCEDERPGCDVRDVVGLGWSVLG